MQSLGDLALLLRLMLAEWAKHCIRISVDKRDSICPTFAETGIKSKRLRGKKAVHKWAGAVSFEREAMSCELPANWLAGSSLAAPS